MSYQVKKKFSPRGAESLVSSFKDPKQAKQFIQEKLAEDAALKLNAIYTLYEGMDLVEEFDQSKLEVTSDSASESAGGQQKGSGQAFSPTPFNTAPRPAGMPHSWLKDEEDKKDDEK